MSAESDALTRAREALARHDVPQCGKRWLYSDGCFPCELPTGHTGFCGKDPLSHLESVSHLRTALAEVDRLQNVLLVERGEGVPPPGGWEWHRASRRWLLRAGGHLTAIVSIRSFGWGSTVKRGDERVIESRRTAYEAMEAANAVIDPPVPAAPQNPRPACANSLHIATEPGYAEPAQTDRRDP